MAFKKREIPGKTPKRKVTSSPRISARKRRYKKKKSLNIAKNLKNTILYLLLGFILLGGLASIILYKKYIQDLPSVEELENLEIAESSTIYDRDGGELYSIFKEKRTYVGYEDINQNMIEAIVAGEDKRFFENPGVDLIGLFRAVLYRATGKSDSLQGTSTLTQQLIRNTIITNERTAERKIKEMYLAYKLTNDVSKEKILELYLNKISFGSNAYGIEQAAKTFFGKSANDLDVFESSVLASLPKGPTYYSPYNNFDRVVGHPYIYTIDEEENTLNLITQEDIGNNNDAVNKLRNFIKGLTITPQTDSRAIICGLNRDKVKQYISVDGQGCSVINYSDLLSFLNGIKIHIDDSNVIEYQTGRKDFILGRMLEDKYITFEQYQEAVLQGFGYKFKQYRENIKYPYFVFYIREYLEQKYGKEVVEKGGLKVYTTIDPKIQEKGQEIVKKYADQNTAAYGATNAALVSIDNRSGEIVAMVGGKDYFDEENKGNVNIITSRLQPGSTFKPFVYSMAVDKEQIGTKTPIYDVKTEFPGGYIPNNFDGKFKGKMNITTALNHSRNIPAVKMFFLSGGEEEIVKYMTKLGAKTIGAYKQEYFENYGKEYAYGASMSLGTALMTPLELAESYSVFANMGVRKDITPITKIYDSKGLLIEEFIPEEHPGEQVLDPSTAYIMNYMLSDTSARPSTWNKYLDLSDRKVAAKTGTSTKQYTKGGVDYIFPRNLWTAGYTPQYTTITWAGNTDGKEVRENGSGLTGAGPMWKEFMEYVHIGEPVQDWERPTGVKEVPISNISGYLAPSGFSPNLIVRSLFTNPPEKYDTNLQTVEVDVLCNGAVGPNTPQAAIKQVTLLAFHSLQPDNPAWERPVQNWAASGGASSVLGSSSGNVIGYVSPNECERPDVASNIEIGTSVKNGDDMIVGSNYIELAYRSNNPMQSIQIFLDSENLKTIPLDSQLQGTYRGDVFIPKGYSGRHNLILRAIDNYYYSQDSSTPINIIGRDPNPPTVTITNPSDNSIKLYKGDSFNLRGDISDRGTIRSINIYLDGVPLKIGLTGRSFVYAVGTNNLTPGNYTIKVEAVDDDLKRGSTTVNLEVLGSGTPPTSEDSGEDTLPAEQDNSQQTDETPDNSSQQPDTTDIEPKEANIWFNQ